jgi:hypothetical protein
VHARSAAATRLHWVRVGRFNNAHSVRDGLGARDSHARWTGDKGTLVDRQFSNGRARAFDRAAVGCERATYGILPWVWSPIEDQAPY